MNVLKYLAWASSFFCSSYQKACKLLWEFWSTKP